MSLGWVDWVDLGLQNEVLEGEKEGMGEGTMRGDTPALGPSCFLVFQEAQLLPKPRPRRDVYPVSLSTALMGPDLKAEGC